MRTRAKRKRVAEIKLQEVDDMYQILMPGRTMVGENAISMAKEQISGLGSHALIISGKIVEKSGIVKKLTDSLDEAGVSYTIFTDIKGEPDDLMVAAAKKVYDTEGCDMVIGIGGGSPQDSAKAVSAASGYAPIVLIPTTAGSGSEATKFYCVTESATDTKKLITDEKVIPRLAVIDPTLSVTAPKSITAATGMDALTHAVEAYTSKKATPYTDIFAISAIKRVFAYLPAAYENGADLEARTQMALAAYEAGVCINNASVTLVHGMSRPIGALFQRRKVKDFFIKFKKKSHFADFFTEHTLDFVLHRLFCGLAEMNTDDIGGLANLLSDSRASGGVGCGIVHSKSSCK